MKKDEFIVWAKGKGWHLDRWGHLQKEINGEAFRFKLSSIAVRYERKIGAVGWVRIVSGYFSKLKITGEGKLSGMTR